MDIDRAGTEKHLAGGEQHEAAPVKLRSIVRRSGHLMESIAKGIVFDEENGRAPVIDDERGARGQNFAVGKQAGGAIIADNGFACDFGNIRTLGPCPGAGVDLGGRRIIKKKNNDEIGSAEKNKLAVVK